MLKDIENVIVFTNKIDETDKYFELHCKLENEVHIFLNAVGLIKKEHTEEREVDWEHSYNNDLNNAQFSMVILLLIWSETHRSHIFLERMKKFHLADFVLNFFFKFLLSNVCRLFIETNERWLLLYLTSILNHRVVNFIQMWKEMSKTAS